MKLNYPPNTDSLLIDLSERPGVEIREVSEGVVLDYDSSERLVGIDIDDATNKVELQKIDPQQASRQDQNRGCLKSRFDDYRTDDSRKA
jgi:uncharacterized protein YuzE